MAAIVRTAGNGERKLKMLEIAPQLPDAFLELGLPPIATNSEILAAMMKNILSKPQNMNEFARLQSLLLNPQTRFWIEFLYYPDFQKTLKIQRPAHS